MTPYRSPYLQLVLILALGIFTLPQVALAKASPLDVPRKKSVISAREAAIFYANVAARIQKEYVKDVSQEELLEGALKGMLVSLDPHSTYLSPNKLKAIKDSVKGEYGGLGMEVIAKNGIIMIVSPMDDTPADRAGLKPGDLILKVGDKPVLNEDLGDIVKLMQGKPGTKVTLTIRRDNKDPFEVTLSRAIIKVDAVKSKIIGNIGYIRIISFINKNTKEEVLKATRDIQKKLGSKLKGFVLDLRNNAGGLLDQAVDVTDIFIKSGTVVSIKGRNSKESQVFKTNDDEDQIKGKPMVVLINGGSASASEIVAGALQDHGRAVVLGTKSFGKGSVQVIMPMTNGGAIKMTTSLYYTPNGRSIQKDGVIPDIEIKQSYNTKELDDSKRLRESNFKNALDLDGDEDEDEDTEGSNKTSDKKKPGLKLAITDFQLSRAIDVLKGMSIYAGSIVPKLKTKPKLVKTS